MTYSECSWVWQSIQQHWLGFNCTVDSERAKLSWCSLLAMPTASKWTCMLEDVVNYYVQRKQAHTLRMVSELLEDLPVSDAQSSSDLSESSSSPSSPSSYPPHPPYQMNLTCHHWVPIQDTAPAILKTLIALKITCLSSGMHKSRLSQLKYLQHGS